jgi:transglutaminase-like putative cysteine protease
MSFAGLHKLVAYLLSGLGLLALSLGGELDALALTVIALGWFASLFAEGERIARPAWSRGWTAGVVAFLAVQLVRGALGGPLLALAMEFTALLQISRLMNRRGAGDYQQIAVLAFLHLIAATVLSTELTYGLIFLGFVIVTPWMLALSHLRREIEGNYPGASPTEGRAVADVRRVLASRRVIGPRFLAGTAALALPIFVLTAAIFLFFPRVGLGLLTFGHGRSQRVAGFGNSVDLSGFGTIRDDPTVVLRVAPPVGTPTPRPPRLALRLRGTSFDRYDGRRWTRSPSQPRSIGHLDEVYPLSRHPQSGRDQPLRIVLEPLEERVLFLPPRTVAVSIRPRSVSGVSLGRDLHVSPGMDLRYADGDDVGLVYVAHVSTDPREATLPAPTESERSVDLLVPAGHERVAALAQTLTAGATNDREKAERLTRYLRDGGRFRYTLELTDPGDAPPLDVFLFRTRAGHCEFFATALAILLRASGVPARNATGFLGGRYNRYGDYYAVRQGDAHSWVEAWLGDTEGWVTFDPTPPQRSELGPQEGALSGLEALFDALRTRWTTRVVGYDLESQLSLFRSLGHLLRGLSDDDGPRQHRGLDASDLEHARHSPFPRTMALVVLLAALLIALAVVRVTRARRARSGTQATPLVPAQRDAVALYRELERALASVGHARSPSTTPREHAEALTAAGFEAAEATRVVTDAYLCARFGGATLAPDALAALRRRVREVRRARA